MRLGRTTNLSSSVAVVVLVRKQPTDSFPPRLNLPLGSISNLWVNLRLGTTKSNIAVSINNAAPLIDNFFKAGYAQVVLSSFVFSQSQRELDALVSLVQTECRMLFVWLDVDKTIRDKRRIGRARDGADKAEFLKFVDSVITDPGELKIPNGEYFRVQVDSETPHEVLERVVKSLAKEELALKGTRARNPANWCLPSTGKVPGSIPVKRHV